MCSIEEPDFDDDDAPSITEMTPSTNDSSIISTTVEELCKKCSTAKVAIKIGLKDAQCIDCFLKSVRHKFRATLGSTKCIPRGSSVLLVHNGTRESFVLLDVVKSAISEETFKRIHLQPHVLYINENRNDCPSDISERLKKQLKNYAEFPVFYTTINMIGDKVIALNDLSKEMLNNDDNLSTWENELQSIKDPTSRHEFQQISRNNCIRKAAEQLNCLYAFVSDIGPDLATKFLTNIVLGRGNSVAQDVSLIDNRSTVQIIRPIRDLNEREVEIYIKFSGIIVDELICMKNAIPIGSVQALTANFISGLQSNFSSTVSTVFKTGDKMHSAMERLKVNESNCCKFCHSDLDVISESTTLAAIDYSRFLSLNGNQIDQLNAMEIKNLSANRNQNALCHSCQNIYRDVEPSFGHFLLK